MSDLLVMKLVVAALIVVAAAACANAECGHDPFQRVTARMVEFPAGAPVGGVELSVDVCPDVTVTSHFLGGVAVRMQRDMLYVPQARADGFVPLMTGEQRLLTDFDGGAPLFPVELAERFPHLSETSPAMVVITSVRADVLDDHDPCASKDGITFSVVDHPEAVVSYYGEGDLPEIDPTLTRTSKSGAAEIGGLAKTTSFGDRVVLRAEKEGCEIGFESYPHTGRYALADGVLTAAAAFVPPIPFPLR